MSDIYFHLHFIVKESDEKGDLIFPKLKKKKSNW